MFWFIRKSGIGGIVSIGWLYGGDVIDCWLGGLLGDWLYR